MITLLTSAKNFFIYKEPKGTENFELLEDENEKSTQQNQTKNQVHFKLNTITPNLRENLERVKQELNVPKNQDIVIREFKVARRINAFILYINGMVDKNAINNFILGELMSLENFTDFKEGCTIDYIVSNVLSIDPIVEENEYEKIIEKVLNGVTVLFIEGCEKCLIIENQGYEKRSVEQPVTEKVIRGPQEGFTESLRTNIALIRKIIKNKDLVTEIIAADKTNKTNCAILYIEGIANPSIIMEVKRRIQNLNIDLISSNGMLEELISDQPRIIFPQISTTERPDRTSSFLMDGKVIIIIDGTPFASSVPTSFFESLQSPEDFSLKWQYATFLRYLRLSALFMTLMLPGLYTAVTLFHQEMIPTELLSSIVKARENVPFSTIIEILLLEISFELIREGGLRVPGAIGNTLGIVGALILGQAAVQAQLVSPILIIVISIAGISSFAIPSYSVSFTIRLLRFIFIILGGIVGFYGISVAIVIIIGLACNVKSFGVPYFAPIAPKTKANPDVITSLTADKQKIRPDFANPLNNHKTGLVKEALPKRKDDNKK